MKIAGRLLLVVAAIALVYSLFMFAMQRKVAFPGVARDLTRNASTVPKGVEQVWLPTEAGSVEAWFLDSRADTAGPTVIFAHGNYELIDDWLEPMQSITAMGVSVLLVEFPGYGHSMGEPSRASLREAFTSAYDWLAGRSDVNEKYILAMGRSVGGGAVCDLASDRKMCGLILLSTFSSAKQLAWEAISLPSMLLRDRFDNVAVIRSTKTPILLLHGENDTIIPFSHARTLANARDGLKPIALKCGHNDSYKVWFDIVARIRNFLYYEEIL